MKKIVALVMAGCMAGGMATCAAAEEPLKVGFSLPAITFPFYVRMYEQMEEEAKERGWELSFVDGNLDAGTQMNGLQDMINNEVDVIVAASWYIDALTDIFVQCEEKGIAVFLMDNMVIPDECETAITFTTGTDNYDAGVVGGTWYADYLEKNQRDSINIVTMAQWSEQTTKRATGFIDALKENGIEVNELNSYNAGKRETAMTCMEDALTAYDDLTVAYGCSAQDSLGAYDATAGANRGEVEIFGFDGEDEELELIYKGTNYIATITQDPKGQASLLADNLDKYLAGESIEQIQKTPAGVYCAEGQLTGAEILGE